ncbi:MAG: histidine phosphatase family protein [Candidatus Borkfalkiaceae bacterium]|nr:histidine phosphatase family protein [Christensenellaceae bacterium]
MKILIIRHGDPDYSIDSLTERGKIEAKALNEYLKTVGITHAYRSPLGRAKLTAEMGLDGINVPLETCDWLREFEGTIKTEEGERHAWDLLPAYYAIHPELKSDNWISSPQIVETDFKKKYFMVGGGLDEILQKHGYKPVNGYLSVENGNKNVIAFFCHFGVECVMLSHLFGISPYPLWQNFCALPSSVTTIVTEERRKGIASLRLLGFGETAHLYKKDITPSFAARFRENAEDNDRM